MGGVIVISNELSWQTSQATQETIIKGVLDRLPDKPCQVRSTLISSLLMSPFMYVNIFTNNNHWQGKDFDLFIQCLTQYTNQCREQKEKGEMYFTEDFFTSIDNLVLLLKRRRMELEQILFLLQQNESKNLHDFILQFDHSAHRCADLSIAEDSFWNSSFLKKKSYSLTQFAHDYLTYSIMLSPWFKNKVDFMGDANFLKEEYIPLAQSIINEGNECCPDRHHHLICLELRKLLALWTDCLTEFPSLWKSRNQQGNTPNFQVGKKLTFSFWSALCPPVVMIFAAAEILQFFSRYLFQDIYSKIFIPRYLFQKNLFQKIKFSIFLSPICKMEKKILFSSRLSKR